MADAKPAVEWAWFVADANHYPQYWEDDGFPEKCGWRKVTIQEAMEWREAAKARRG